MEGVLYQTKINTIFLAYVIFFVQTVFWSWVRAIIKDRAKEFYFYSRERRFGMGIAAYYLAVTKTNLTYEIKIVINAINIIVKRFRSKEGTNEYRCLS